MRGGRVDWTVGDRALVVPTTIPRRQLEESLKGSSSTPSQGEGMDLHYTHLPCPSQKPGLNVSQQQDNRPFFFLAVETGTYTEFSSNSVCN